MQAATEKGTDENINFFKNESLAYRAFERFVSREHIRMYARETILFYQRLFFLLEDCQRQERKRGSNASKNR